MPNTLSHLMICGRVINDLNTNLFSYLDVYDEIIVPQGQDYLDWSFWIVGKVNISDNADRIIALVRFVMPNGEESTPLRIEGSVRSGPLRLAVYLPHMRFTQIGKYYLKINFQNQELETENRFYFEVKKQA